MAIVYLHRWIQNSAYRYTKQTRFLKGSEFIFVHFAADVFNSHFRSVLEVHAILGTILLSTHSFIYYVVTRIRR